MVQLYLENGVAGFPVYLQCSDMSDLSSQLVILQSSKKMKLLQLVEITKDIIVGLNAAFLNEHGSYGIETFRPPVNKVGLVAAGSCSWGHPCPFCPWSPGRAGPCRVAQLQHRGSCSSGSLGSTELP